jgi:hypothetical protein
MDEWPSYWARTLVTPIAFNDGATRVKNEKAVVPYVACPSLANLFVQRVSSSTRNMIMLGDRGIEIVSKQYHMLYKQGHIRHEAANIFFLHRQCKAQNITEYTRHALLMRSL